MKNSTFVGLSVLTAVGVGAALLYYRERKAKTKAVRPSSLPRMSSVPSPTGDPATTGIVASDMIAAGLPLPAGFAQLPSAPMNGLQLVSRAQLNTRPKNGVAGMGSFMDDIKAVAKTSLLITEASILPFDKNITRKLGATVHTLPGMKSFPLIGPVKPKVSAPAASTLDPTVDSEGFTGTGNGIFQNTVTGQILDAAPSLLAQYAGQPGSILPLLIAGSVPSAGATDPQTGLPSMPSSPGSAQTYGWPSVWTPVPGYSPWQYIADQPVGGDALTAAGAYSLPVINPSSTPTGAAMPTNVPKKSGFNPLVAAGAAVLAVPVFFLVGK